MERRDVAGGDCGRGSLGPAADRVGSGQKRQDRLRDGGHPRSGRPAAFGGAVRPRAHRQLRRRAGRPGHRRCGAGNAAFPARRRDRGGSPGRQARVRGKAVHTDTRRRRTRGRGLPGGRHHAACRLQSPLCAGLWRDGPAHHGRQHRRAAPCRGQFFGARELPDRTGQLALQPNRKPRRRHDRARRARARQHGQSVRRR